MTLPASTRRKIFTFSAPAAISCYFYSSIYEYVIWPTESPGVGAQTMGADRRHTGMVQNCNNTDVPRGLFTSQVARVRRDAGRCLFSSHQPFRHLSTWVLWNTVLSWLVMMNKPGSGVTGENQGSGFDFFQSKVALEETESSWTRVTHSCNPLTRRHAVFI